MRRVRVQHPPARPSQRQFWAPRPSQGQSWPHQNGGKPADQCLQYPRSSSSSPHLHRHSGLLRHRCLPSDCSQLYLAPEAVSTGQASCGGCVCACVGGGGVGDCVCGGFSTNALPWPRTCRATPAPGSPPGCRQFGVQVELSLFFGWIGAQGKVQWDSGKRGGGHGLRCPGCAPLCCRGCDMRRNRVQAGLWWTGGTACVHVFVCVCGWVGAVGWGERCRCSAVKPWCG